MSARRDDRRGAPGTAKLLTLRRVQGAANEMSDEALLSACAVGESAALGALFDRHHRVVYRFLSRMVGVREGEIDDLVQTTFLMVWRASARFRARGAVRSWILGIACNVARRHARGEARRRAAHQGYADCPPAEVSAPDDAAESREMAVRLERALRRLPHDLRVAFVLCELEGLAGVEAAQVVGCRQGTMWRRLHEARKALREELIGRAS